MSEKNETYNQDNNPENTNDQNTPETNNAQNQENQNNASQSQANYRYSDQNNNNNTNNKNSTNNENTKSTNNLNATSKSTNFNKTNQKNKTFNNANRKKLPPLAVSRTKASFYKTSINNNNNNNNFLSSTQKSMTTSQINPNQNPELIDNINLKQELIDARTEYNNKKQEFNELKIEFGKLLEDNRQNKALIERVLKIDPNEPCTKAEAREKIENANPTEEEKKELKNALTQIQLKQEINDVKNQLKNTNKEYDSLKKRAKSSTIVTLEKEILNKTNDLRKLSKVVKKMNNILEKDEERIKDWQTKYDYYKEEYEKSKNENMDLNKQIEKDREDQNKLEEENIE